MQSFHGGAKGYTRKRQHVERAAAGTITNNLPILHQDSSIEYWQKMLQFSFLSFLPTITFAHWSLFLLLHLSQLQLVNCCDNLRSL